MYDIITTANFRTDLSACIRRVELTGKRLLITRNGKDTVALVTVQDMDALENVENRREELVRLRHERMMEEFQALKQGLRRDI